MSSNSDQQRKRKISRDKEQIREWADEHDAVPVRETKGKGESGRFRMLPEREVSDNHERVDWDTFFAELDEGDHVVIYHGDEGREPFEVTGHGDVMTRVDDEEIEERLLAGETVTSTITETAVVESVVVEEIDIESELVDSETIDQRVIDAELLRRECLDCDLVEDRAVEGLDWFDSDRYLTTRETVTEREAGPTDRERSEVTFEDVETEFPYHPELDVEETWSVTAELVDEYTVESRISDTDISEADTLEDYDIDVQGLHRSIAESSIVDSDRDISTEEFLANCEVESELSETDRVTTKFTRTRTIEDEIVDRRRLRTDITGISAPELETIRTNEVETGREREMETEREMAVADEERELTEDDVGKQVVDATGEKIGMVTDVDEAGNAMYVDAHPGITERIKATLGWGKGDEDDYRLRAGQIERITGDRVELKREEHLAEDDRDY